MGIALDLQPGMKKDFRCCRTELQGDKVLATQQKPPGAPQPVLKKILYNIDYGKNI